MIAIDGPAGSGKTTLAAELQAELEHRGVGVATFHLDDVYAGWAGLDDALERRVLDQVLLPLAGGSTARWQRYDWLRGRFDGWHALPPPEVLVLEGCGSGATPYAPYTSVLVWVEADRDARIARGIARDGAQVLDNWLAWMALEAEYFAVHRIRERANLSYRTG